jgi:hypothetical protein
MIPASRLQSVVQVLGAAGATVRCPVLGDCMSPTLMPGDSLLIQYGNRDIRAGDIVVSGQPGDIRVLRVIRAGTEQGPGTVTVRADRSVDLPEPIPRERVLGRVIEARGSNGRIRFQSAVWRGANHYLWLRSRAHVWHDEAGPILWLALSAIYLLRTQVFPNCSISLLPVQALCGLNRLWTVRTGDCPNTETEG